MVRLKTPLLSMDAHGTIGDAVTFQSSARRKFAREKPHLPYSLTLNQQYQRWLYEDYCAYWHTLTTTQKNVYRDAGHRFHRTAFQQFMSSMLADLPDLALLCHLDYISGGLTPDSSRNQNTGTVIGASLIDGLIDHAFHFDGINDEVRFGTPASLKDITSPLSILAFVNPASRNNQTIIADRLDAPVNRIQYALRVDTNDLLFYFHDGVGFRTFNAVGVITPGAWQHVALTFSGTEVIHYVAGLPVSTLPCAFTPVSSPGQVLIGNYEAGAEWFFGDIDHLIFKNRVVSPADVLRHSIRRYLP